MLQRQSVALCRPMAPPAAPPGRAAEIPPGATPTAPVPLKPAPPAPRELGGPKGPDPTRYGDWEKAGRCIDF